jgi:glycosyltransferase involved in cell wall biosynthesis
MNVRSDPIRVLHLLGPLRPSGMERMLASGESHFRREGIVNIVVGQGVDHPFADELRAAGCEVRALPAAVGGSWRGARALRDLARQVRVDVIHIHTEGNYLRTALACRLALGLRGSLVRTIHSLFHAAGIWRARRFMQAVLADRLVFSLIAPSPDVASNERTLGRRVNVIYNWVDDRFFAIGESRRNRDQVPPEQPIALIVGNCSEIKQHELGLRALASTTHRLIHIGDERGASPEERALLQQLDDEGRLIDRGIQPPDAALAHADYFLMSSRHEGMGVALAEALVAGIPALVNDAPGLRWARPLDGVRMAADSDTAWTRGLDNLRLVGAAIKPPMIDFSAARGAFEYASVYRAAESRRRLVRWRSARRS